jgi:hypothetical protein
MFVQLGNLRTQTSFIVVSSLAAECILGCQYIDRHVSAISPKEKRVLVSDGSIIPILQDSAAVPVNGKRAPTAKPAIPSTKVRVAKLTTLTPRAECLVWVQCASSGLRFLQALRKGSTLGVYMANGVADVMPLKPFQVRVINTSERERKLHKGMILGHALPHLKGIVALVDEMGSNQTPEPSFSEHSEYADEERRTCKGPDEQCVRGQDPPPLPDRPEIEGDLWREDVDLALLTPQERERVFQILGKHRSMWDGRLGHVHSTSHHIDLVPGAKPVHARPYRAGARAREAESFELQRMLKAGVIEPANSEWASPVVLVPKPDGSMRFCIDYRRLNMATVRD